MADEINWVQKLAGPTGLLLLLLLFLFLPAVTASCSVPPDAAGSIDVAATGADVVLGGTPNHETSGSLRVPPSAQARLAADAVPGSTARALSCAAVVVMVLGLGIMFVRARRPRAIVTVAVAAVAVVLLAVTEVVLVNQWVSLAEENAEWLVYLPEAEGIDVVGRADEVVHAGWGFWSAFAGLVLTAAANAALLIRRGRGQSRA